MYLQRDKDWGTALYTLLLLIQVPSLLQCGSECGLWQYGDEHCFLWWLQLYSECMLSIDKETFCLGFLITIGLIMHKCFWKLVFFSLCLFFFFFFSPLTPVAVQWKVVLHPVFSFVLNHTMISQMCTYPWISFGLHVKNPALCEWRLLPCFVWRKCSWGYEGSKATS